MSPSLFCRFVGFFVVAAVIAAVVGCYTGVGSNSVAPALQLSLNNGRCAKDTAVVAHYHRPVPHVEAVAAEEESRCAHHRAVVAHGADEVRR